MEQPNIRIKDIAQKAGVSKGTIDRVLHNRGEVNAKTKEKVLAILKESGYQPNLIARALTSKKESIIAVLIPQQNKENPYWQKPLKGMISASEEIKPFNFNIEYCLFDQYDENQFKEKIKQIIELQPQAVVIAPVFKQATSLLTENLNKSEIPYIFINSDIPTENRLRFIGQDSYSGGYMAAKLLFYGLKAKGTILIINNSKNTDQFVDRKNGFLSFYKENVQKDKYTIIKKDIISNFENNINEIFEEHKDIVGIYVLGSKSYLAAEYIEKINRKDIILIGYDVIDQNLKYLESGYIDFIISQRSQEQGHLSIIELFNYIAKRKTETSDILMPIDIITKENYKFYR